MSIVYNHIMKFSEMKLCHNIYSPIHFIKHPVEIWGVFMQKGGVENECEICL